VTFAGTEIEAGRLSSPPSTLSQSVLRPPGVPSLDLFVRIGRASYAAYILAGLMGIVAATLFFERAVVFGVLFAALAVAVVVGGWNLSRTARRMAAQPRCRSCGTSLEKSAGACPRCGTLQ
jgi:peptidoglycan/LPS O-acetylase OafA/YrhL